MFKYVSAKSLLCFMKDVRVFSGNPAVLSIFVTFKIYDIVHFYNRSTANIIITSPGLHYFQTVESESIVSTAVGSQVRYTGDQTLRYSI